MVTAGTRSSLLVLILVFGLLFALLYIPSTFSETSSQELTVKTDRLNYQVGDTVTISGTVSNAILRDAGLPTIILIYNPEGNLQRADQVSLTTGGSGGSFSYKVNMGGSFGSVQGEYRVAVNYADHQAETRFNLI